MAQVANNDAYVTVEDQPLSVGAAAGVRANDVTLGFLVPVVDWGSPSNGTLTVTSPDGAFTYVPNTNFNGVDSFTYQLRDQLTGLVSNTATVIIAVTAVNDAPLGVVNRSYGTPQDTSLRVDAPGVLAGVADVESNAVSAALVTNVAPATGTLTLSADGAFTFNPAAGFSGTATFSYRGVDNGVPPAQTAPANVVITVTDVNDVPVANPDGYAGTEDTVLNVAAPGVLGNDTDPDVGARLTAVLATSVPAAAGTLTLNADGSFAFQPAANFAGVTSFTYNARDNAAPPGQSATPATVTITVAAVNDAPVAAADSYETNENLTLTVPAVGVLANDTDAENGALTAELVTSVAPVSGTLSLSPNGSFSYSPAAGFSGTATFTYRAVESAIPPVPSVAAATVTITVRNVNDPPVAVTDAFTATEDTALNVAAPGVLGNDSDPDAGTLLTALVVAPPAHGTLTLNANGSLSYLPAADYNGPDTFTYRARDNATPPLDSAVVTVTINIASANDAPRFALGITALPSQTATENVPVALALAPFFDDPEGSPLTFVVTGLPPGVTATPAGVIGGTPTLALAVGTFTINVEVSDGQNQFAASFTLLVLAAGRTDLALSGTATPSPAVINQPVTWSYAIDNGSPVENVGNLTLRVVFSGPPSLVVTPGPRCTAAPQAGGTTVVCAAGPVAASGGIAVTMTGSSAQPGDVVAAASIAITDSLPVDAVPANDSATVVLNIAQSLAAGPAQTLSGVGYRASASGDFDGDGFIDLAIATEGGVGTLIYPNVLATGTPGSTKRALAAQPIALGDAGVSTGIAVADLDGDRAVDLIVAKASGPSVALRNPNNGTFGFVAATTALGAAGDVTRAVAAHDLDGDGRVDIVLGNTGANRVFTNQGNWIFTPVAALGNDDSRDSVVVDLAGDGAPEIVFANANRDATVYSFDTVTGRYRETVLASGQATSVAAADFDANGRVDLVFGRAQSKVVLFNTTPLGAALQFSAPVDLGASPTADVIATDTDADGDADIVGINMSGSHQIYANNGVGQFTLRPEQFASAGALNATAAKLSVDDRVDVAVVGASGLEVFYNDGAGNFGRGDTSAPTIRLRGQASVSLTVESPYTDDGATAADTIDGDLTAKIKVDNPVNPAVIGPHTVTYTVVDNSGNAAVPVTRTVTVAARQATGGGGGGAFDLRALLFVSVLVLLRALRRPAARRNLAEIARG